MLIDVKLVNFLQSSRFYVWGQSFLQGRNKLYFKWAKFITIALNKNHCMAVFFFFFLQF